MAPASGPNPVAGGEPPVLRRPHLLITNDDGVYSPGLLALANCAAAVGEVKIFAPDVEQSSVGHAITHSRPLHVKRTPIAHFEAWRVNGTPADCVALGVNAWKDVTAVLSGINMGPNIGNAAWHSGTLAAARQAALLGTRAIAFSTPAETPGPDFALLAPFVTRVLDLLLSDPHTPQLVNVNLPAIPKGLVWTRLSSRHYDGHVAPGEDPMGRKHYWLTVKPIEEIEEGTDRWAVQHGMVSLTPLRLDLTDDEGLAEARERYPL